MPRIYLEIASMRSYHFFYSGKEVARKVSLRTTSIRGIGDPLFALYCRIFLGHQLRAHFALSERAELRISLVQSFKDYVFTVKQRGAVDRAGAELLFKTLTIDSDDSGFAALKEMCKGEEELLALLDTGGSCSANECK